MSKKFILPSLLVFALSAFAFFPQDKTNPFTWEDAPMLCDSTAVSLYSHYMVLPEVSTLQSVNFSEPGKYENFDIFYIQCTHPSLCGDIEGTWRIKGDSITFFETSLKERFDYIEFYYTEVQWLGDKITGLRTLNYIPMGANGNRGDNVSFGTIKNFGQSIILPTYDEAGNQISNITLVYIPGVKYFSDKKMTSRDIFPDMTKEEYKERWNTMSFEPNERFRLNFFPWKQLPFNWQKGFFEVVAKQIISKKVVKVNVMKNSTIFTVVNPQFYLPESGLRLYDKADEEALSAWMDTVQVGRSYEFELMRPAYPADSIADFLPLRTIPGSIYAADGEAYGYFFARIKSKIRK